MSNIHPIHNVIHERSEEYTYAMTDHRWALIIVGALFTLIACITLTFRFLVVIIKRRPQGFDDYAMYLAFAGSISFATAAYISVRWGVGLNVDDVPYGWEPKAIHALYVVQIIYYITIFLVKMSLMFMYLRIASDLGGGFYKGSIVMTIVLAAQFVSTIIVSGLQCIPLSYYWDQTPPGHCINLTWFFYSTNIFTIVTDMVILALPIPTLWKVQRPRRERIGVLSVFLIGIFSTIASGIRLYSIRIYTESDEKMRDAAPITTWSFIEINMGILCASVPAIKPLFTTGESLRPRQLDLNEFTFPFGEMSKDISDVSKYSHSQLTDQSTLRAESTPPLPLSSRVRQHPGSKLRAVRSADEMPGTAVPLPPTPPGRSLPRPRPTGSFSWKMEPQINEEDIDLGTQPVDGSYTVRARSSPGPSSLDDIDDQSIMVSKSVTVGPSTAEGNASERYTPEAHISEKRLPETPTTEEPTPEEPVPEKF